MKISRPKIDGEDTALDRIISAGVIVFIVALLIAGIYYAGKLAYAGISYAETKRATAECEKWADEAKVFPNYFIVGWQKEQCDTYGVEIDAPLINNTK